MTEQNLVTIDPSNPALPLIAWALFVLPKAAQPSYDRVHVRLSQLAPDPPPVDLAAAAALLECPADLLALSAVIRRIVELAGLGNLDPGFDWDRLELSPPYVTQGIMGLPWQWREQARFLLGEYEPLPWASELAPIPDHFAHLSTEKPGLVAYTQDAAKGEADTQTQIRPGRYLTRFYSHLSAADVRRLVVDVPRPATLGLCAHRRRDREGLPGWAAQLHVAACRMLRLAVSSRPRLWR